MAQWINLNRNTQLPLLYEKSGAMLLVLVGLKLAGWQSDQILVGSPIALLGFSQTLTKECCYHRVTNVLRSVFWVGCIVEVRRSGTLCFFRVDLYY